VAKVGVKMANEQMERLGAVDAEAPKVSVASHAFAIGVPREDP
jgi:hypothetical protein